MPGVTIGVSYSSNHEEDIAKLHTRMPYCCKLFEIWYEILQLSLYGMKIKQVILFCFFFTRKASNVWLLQWCADGNSTLMDRYIQKREVSYFLTHTCWEVCFLDLIFYIFVYAFEPEYSYMCLLGLQVYIIIHVRLVITINRLNIICHLYSFNQCFKLFVP